MRAFRSLWRLCVPGILSLAVMLAGLATLPAYAAPPDTVFFNAKVVTMGPGGAIAQAVCVADGKFLAVGTNEEMKKLAGPATQLVDLGGKTVLPGLIDAHCHPMETVFLKDNWVDARYPGTKSVKQALENIAEWVKKTPKGEWVFVACASASQNKFEEKRLPTKAELDSVAPDNPVVLADGAHLCVVNSPALKLLGITKGVTKLQHGTTVIMDQNGEPTGALADAQADVPTNPTVKDLERFYTTGIQSFWNQNGFTSLMAITPATALPVLQAVAKTGVKPTIRFSTSVWTSSNAKNMPEDVSGFRMPKEADPSWYKFAAIKDWIDGENDARTGYMCEPYVGHADTDPVGNRGTLVTDQAGANRFAAIAAKNGVISMIHCSGDKAVTMGLDAYDALLKAGTPAPIMRIEHFGMFQLKDEQLARAKQMMKSGLRVVVQPIWLSELVKADFENMDPKLAATGFKFRSMVDAGLEPAASSDMTGIYLGNINPFKAMAAVVTRQSDMGLFEPEQALTPEEALKMWTVWGAKAMGEADSRGSIEPGKLADMTVISGDLLTMPKEKIADITVVKTIVGGKVVYESK
ncbi:MAG: amidohydrolase [Desulfovibrio sp.]|nr:amidohydrolase [Desulfovibrio sp.]MBI4961258.1 amidohydrolase [Desulfovibrio sp.]